MYFGESIIPKISVLENNFLVALQDFDNFNTSIRILKETGIILEDNQEQKTKKTLIEKIKEIWIRFKEWIKGIWEKIKGLFRKRTQEEKEIEKICNHIKSYKFSNGKKSVNSVNVSSALKYINNSNYVDSDVIKECKDLISIKNIAIYSSVNGSNIHTKGIDNKIVETINNKYFERFDKWMNLIEESKNKPKTDFMNIFVAKDGGTYLITSSTDRLVNEIRDLINLFDTIYEDTSQSIDDCKHDINIFEDTVEQIVNDKIDMTNNSSALSSLREDIDTLKKFNENVTKILVIIHYNYKLLASMLSKIESLLDDAFEDLKDEDNYEYDDFEDFE